MTNYIVMGFGMAAVSILAGWVAAKVFPNSSHSGKRRYYPLIVLVPWSWLCAVVGESDLVGACAFLFTAYANTLWSRFYENEELLRLNAEINEATRNVERTIERIESIEQAKERQTAQNQRPLE